MSVPRASYPMMTTAQLESLCRDSNVPDDLVTPLTNVLRKILNQQTVDERLNYRFIANQRIPDFYQDGALTVSSSGVWSPRFPLEMVGVQLDLDVAGSTSTVVEVQKNGSLYESAITIPASTTMLDYFFNNPFTFNGRTDRMKYAVTTAGTGATSLTLTPIIA